VLSYRLPFVFFILKDGDDVGANGDRRQRLGFEEFRKFSRIGMSFFVLRIGIKWF
jgi:hypothetical protein